MDWTQRLLLTAGVLALPLLPQTAQACGGFFCDGVVPVVQAAERILFHVRTKGSTTTITTIVEIQYEGQPQAFAWVLPVPEGLTADQIDIAPAGIFDDLEALTAPTFHEPEEDGYGDSGGASASGDQGCAGFGGGYFGDGGPPPPPPDTSGVEVVGEAVVGPYEIEIITAGAGENLANWLTVNGYAIPPGADEPMQHYVDAGTAFAGVKLRPDTPSGPIEALMFTYQADFPMIPLLLTAIAAAPEMEIVTYVLGDEPWRALNWEEVPFDYQQVSWTGSEDTDYEPLLREAVQAEDGRAWNVEFSRSTDVVLGRGPAEEFVRDLLAEGDQLTRFHTYLSGEQMTRDPLWVPNPSGADVDNNHILYGASPAPMPPARQPLGTVFVLLPLLALGFRRRR